MPHLTPYLRAGYAGIVLLTHEEARSFAWLQHTARESGYTLREWNTVDGLINHSATPPTVSPTDEGLPELLRRIPDLPEGAIGDAIVRTKIAWEFERMRMEAA